MPILLLVSQGACPYCDLLKQEILQPMVISGAYRDRVLIRELLIDEDDTLIDFDGQPVTGRSFAKRYLKRLFTPTLLFLDHEGRERTKRMIGITTPEMYGYYVDESIDKAIGAIRGE